MNAMRLTPTRALLGLLPIVLMTITPLLPFATEPTLWFGMPAVLVWVALLVVLTLVVLQVIDRSVAAEPEDESLPIDGEA